MREIKFRFWEESSSKMIIDDIDRISKNPSVKISEVFEGKDIIHAMQFIGLKDSKRTKEYPDGQDIYEGDYDVDFQVVMWCDKRNGWALKIYDFPTKEVISCHCHNCEGNFDIGDDEIEIIGNIHEINKK